MKRLAQVEQVSDYLLSPFVTMPASDVPVAESAFPEVTAAIAHEVNQPLGVILTSAETALRWLTADPPNLDRAQRALERVVQSSRRAADVVKGVRGLARKSPSTAA